MRTRRLIPAAALAATVGLVLAGCGSSGGDTATGGGTPSAVPTKGAVTVVQAGYTENDILAQAYAKILEANNYTVTVKTVANREIYSPELEKGNVDIVPDYLGSAANYYEAQKTKNPDAVIATSDVTTTLASLNTLLKADGLSALQPSTATDQNAFAVSKTFAADNKLTTLSDLGASKKAVIVAGPAECKSRPLCGVALTKTYGIDVTKYQPFEFNAPTARKQVADGKAQIAVVATTNAQLGEEGLVVLTDDKKVQPAENLVPIIGKGSPILTDTAVIAALNKFSAALTTEDLGKLNDKVDLDKEKASDVAQEYLDSKGLI